MGVCLPVSGYHREYVPVGTYVGRTRADGGISNTEFLSQRSQRLDNTDNCRLAGKVQGRLHGMHIPAHARKPQEVALDLAVLQPVVDRNLC